MSIISRFNPYEMTDEQITSLTTGREKELSLVTKIIEANLKKKSPPQHILLHGPRGSGKSFFLKLLQIYLRENHLAKCILLPEEQRNIHQPADLLRVVKNTLMKEDSASDIGSWFAGGMEEWNEQVSELEDALSSKEYAHMVLGLENLDLLLQKGGAFSDSADQALLRAFLSEKSYLTVIATTLYPDLDTQYDKALFHFFAKHELIPWKEKEHKTFLSKRHQLEGRTTDMPSLSQIKALTRFTGGSPRITVIMADILALDMLISVVETLERTIDDLTPFYQDLLEKIPAKSKLLFDALIRGGEPCSQSELAKRVGATQNVISQSFNWLQTHNYLLVESLKGERQKLCSVRDRMFAHFYRMRYILHGSGKSLLTVMSEFLCRFYSAQELKKQAIGLLNRGREIESRDLMHLALETSGIDPNALLWREDLTALSKAIDLHESKEITKPKTVEEARELLVYSRDMLAASQTGLKELDGKKMARILFETPILPLELKLRFAHGIIKSVTGDKGLRLLKQFLSATETVDQGLISQIGSAYKKIQAALKEGRIILEFLDDESLATVKEKDPEVYYSLLVLSSVLRWTYEKFSSKLKWTPGLPSTPPEEKKLIEAHQYLLEFNTKAKNTDAQAWNLGQIGWNLSKSGHHEEALDAHQKALDLYTQVEDVAEQTSELGQIAVLMLLKGDEEGAWEIIDKNTKSLGKKRYRMVQQIGDAISYYDRENETAKAFALGTRVLHQLRERKEAYDPAQTLQEFFVGLLSKKLSLSLLKDLHNAAIEQFGEEIRQELEGISGVIEYLMSEKDQNTLLKMDPEKRRAVEAILESLSL